MLLAFVVLQTTSEGRVPFYREVLYDNPLICVIYEHSFGV